MKDNNVEMKDNNVETAKNIVSQSSMGAGAVEHTSTLIGKPIDLGKPGKALGVAGVGIDGLNAYQNYQDGHYEVAAFDAGSAGLGVTSMAATAMGHPVAAAGAFLGGAGLQIVKDFVKHQKRMEALKERLREEQEKFNEQFVKFKDAETAKLANEAYRKDLSAITDSNKTDKEKWIETNKINEDLRNGKYGEVVKNTLPETSTSSTSQSVWETAKQNAEQAGNSIQNAWNTVWEYAKAGAEKAGNDIQTAWNSENATPSNVLPQPNNSSTQPESTHSSSSQTSWQDSWETVWEYAKAGAEKAGNDIQNAWNDYFNRVKDGAEQAGNNINNAFEKAAETVQDYWNRAKDGLEQMSNDFRNYLEKMKESLEKATQNPEENPEESASSKDGAEDANNPNNPSNEQDHSGSENTIPTNGENVCKNPNPAAASAGGFGKGFGKGGSYDPFNPYTPYYDPLLISLNGNSRSDIYVENHTNENNSKMLDLNGDGIANKVSWIGKNTGILFLDENNNNQMDGFQELLSDGKILENGETSKNGFDYALNVLDTDGNKVLNADDEKFNQIKVLSFNEDNEEQIHTLTGLDIQSLNLNYANVALSAQHSFNNVHGENLVLQESSYTKANGATGKLVDVDFSYDTIHTQYINEIALNDEQSHTANLQGFGYLRDLNQAASLSKDLHHQLNEYSQLTTKDEQLNHLDSLLKSWAQTSPYYSNEPIDIQRKTFYRNDESHSHNASDANIMQNRLLNHPPSLEQQERFNQEEVQEKIHILQSFYGINNNTIYINNPDELGKIMTNINKDYAALKEDTYQHLLFQTRLKPYLQETEIDENE